MTPLKAATFLFAVVATLTTVCGREWTVVPRGSNGSNLTEALAMLESDSVIYLEPGTHQIERFRLLQDLTNVSIVGRGSQAEVTVRCAQNIGLAFVSVSELTIENLSLDGCGLSEENLGQSVVQLREIVDVFFHIPNDTNIGLFLGHCSNVTMQGVTISNTVGLGMAGINIIGNSRMIDVEFSRNIRPFSQCAAPLSFPAGISRDSAQIGGGAFILYSDYQPAFDTNYREAVTLEIEQGNFTENSECTYEGIFIVNMMGSATIRDQGYGIGGAGGLTIYLSQQLYGVEVNVSSTLIQQNTARYGAGALVGIFSGVGDSHILFQDCIVYQNGFTIDDYLNNPSSVFTVAAAGITVANDLPLPSLEIPIFLLGKKVSVSFVNTEFIENGAISGGGAYIYSTRSSPVIDNLDATLIFFDNCTFDRNVASEGSAFVVLEFKLSGVYPGVQITATDLTVKNSRTISTSSQVILSASGNGNAVEIISSNFTIQGNSVFENNSVTALRTNAALIGLNGNITFQNNTGVFGGALHLEMNSFLVISPNSSTRFLYNVGRIQGGAIYVSNPVTSTILFSTSCPLFFGYSDFLFCVGCLDFEKMNIFVEFRGNSALNGSIIYGSAFQQCPWVNDLVESTPGGTSMNILEILNSFYSKYFKFDVNPVGDQQVVTRTTGLILYDSIGMSTRRLSYQAIPGQKLSFNISAFDSYNQNISAVISSYVLDTSSAVPGISVDAVLVVGTSGYYPIAGGMPALADVTVLAGENQTVNGALYAIDAGFTAQVTLEIEVQTCPEGFQFNNATRACQCISYLEENDVTCDASSLAFIVPRSQWYGPTSDGGVAVQSCQFYCENEEKVVKVINGTADYDSQCTSGQNRGGVGCGSCLEGYSLTLGGTRCLKCSNAYIALLLVFALFGIGLVTVIAVFRITITYGLLNGVLFYSNIVSFYAPDLAPSLPYSGRFIFTSFLTLNFGIESCFHSRFTALERLGWQLIFPLYLFILMLLITAFARVLKFKSVKGHNIIQAFSTLMLLCYVSVLQASVELLGVEGYNTSEGNYLLRWSTDPSVAYFRGVHGFLAVIAIILILFYIIPFPIFLLFPSALYRNRRLGKLKPFYDAFWNPFKLKFRPWLGLRLILRWILFAMAIFSSAPTSLFITGIFIVAQLFLLMLVQPFNDFWVNFSDGLLLLNLVLLFMGSLFYDSLAQSGTDIARDSVLDRASSFTTAFVALAYIQFAVIIFYHCVIRFPKLKKFLNKMYEKCKRNKLGRKVLGEPKEEPPASNDSPQTQSTVSDPTATATDSGKPGGTYAPPTIVTFTELREPLLEEGVLELVTVSPPNTGQRTN